MALQNVVNAVQDQILANVSGVQAPDYPEGVRFPLVLSRLGPGTVDVGNPAGAVKGLHNVIVELHVSGQNLAGGFRQIMPLVDSIQAAICKDVTFGGTIETYGRISTSGVGLSSWQGMPTVAYTWTVEACKIITTS